MKSPLCSDASRHQEHISSNQVGKTTLTKEMLFNIYKNLEQELDAARLVIKAIEDDAPRQPWFVLEALIKYYEVVKCLNKSK